MNLTGEITFNPKFCSRTCAQSYNNVVAPKRKTKKKCIICGESVKSYKHSRCLFHHKIYIENKYGSYDNIKVGDYRNKKSLKELHPSSRNAHVRLHARSRFKDLIIKPCAKCGYDKHVELCHIKPISSFDENSTFGDINNYDNLIQLCRNCHWEFDHNLLGLEEIIGVEPMTQG